VRVRGRRRTVSGGRDVRGEAIPEIVRRCAGRDRRWRTRERRSWTAAPRTQAPTGSIARQARGDRGARRRDRRSHFLHYPTGMCRLPAGITRLAAAAERRYAMRVPASSDIVRSGERFSVQREQTAPGFLGLWFVVDPGIRVT